MAEVLFYHLTRSPLEVTLPDLLQKSRTRGWNVVVKGKSLDRLKWLDDRLWQGGDDGFLPHGLDGGPHDALQLVLLSQVSAAPNGAEVMMAVDGADVSVEEANRFSRVCILFDGNDATALDHARGQWKALTDAGCPAKYWSQEGGSWAEKASKNT